MSQDAILYEEIKKFYLPSESCFYDRETPKEKSNRKKFEDSEADNYWSAWNIKTRYIFLQARHRVPLLVEKERQPLFSNFLSLSDTIFYNPFAEFVKELMK